MAYYQHKNCSDPIEYPEELLNLVSQWQKSATHSQRMNILREITKYLKSSEQENNTISSREVAHTVDVLLAKYPGILKMTS